MHDTQSYLQASEMRLDRALLTVTELANSNLPIDQAAYLGSITRIVIGMNTLAQALHAGADDECTSKQVADLLWRFGEGLGIAVDGAR